MAKWNTSLLLGCAGLVELVNCSCSPASIQAHLPTGASVNFAYSLPANSTFQVPAGNLGYPTNPVNLPALCAVSVQVQGIGNTTFGLGLYLPEAWNGRFLAVGQGGFSGGINWGDMAVGVRYGFAALSTDTGHNSTSADGSWAFQQPDVVENWGHLALHESVVIGKNLTAAYYRKGPAYSYYSGCSTGGRQGLKEAEMYPEDFDGIVAGAPAWWTTHLQPWTAKIALYNLPVTADYHIPSKLFTMINEEVLKQCDPQDGLIDSIISDPQGCNFRSETLLCGANATVNSTDCLSSAQLDTLHNIWSDYVDENNTVILPSLWIGSEGTPILVGGSVPNPRGTDYVKYFLGLGPQWNYTDYNDSIIDLSEKLNPGNATVGFDLSAYHAKGGKILSYHGAADPLIPTGITPYFYNHVLETLKPRGVDVDSFFKYFIVPGMGHCQNTTTAYNAPWYFAGPNQASTLGNTVHSVPGFEDKTHDVLLAMMSWVENGTVPEYVVGTKFVNESAPGEVTRQRPLCMHPKVAKWTGEGDVNSAETWSCESLG